MGHVARRLRCWSGAGRGADDADALALRWRLLDVRERTLDLQGRRAEQRADLDALRRPGRRAGRRPPAR